MRSLLGFACVLMSSSHFFPACWFLFSVSRLSRLLYICSMNVKVCSSGTRPSSFPYLPPQHVHNMLRIRQEGCYKNNSTGIISAPPTPIGLPVQCLCIVVNRMVILPPSVVLRKMVPWSDVRPLSHSWGLFFLLSHHLGCVLILKFQSRRWPLHFALLWLVGHKGTLEHWCSLSFLSPEILHAGHSSSHTGLMAVPSEVHQHCPYSGLLDRNERYNISGPPSVTVLPHVRSVSHGSISQDILSA